MIELPEHRLGGRLDVREITHPAERGVRLPRDVHRDAEGMAVQPRTLVTRRHVRQPVSGLDLEFSEDLHESFQTPVHSRFANPGWRIHR